MTGQPRIAARRQTGLIAFAVRRSSYASDRVNGAAADAANTCTRTCNDDNKKNEQNQNDSDMIMMSTSDESGHESMHLLGFGMV